MDRVESQLEFLMQIDRLKGVLRRNFIFDGSRRENSAEHSWHMALMAAVLGEHFPAGVDPARVFTMALVHDLVEIHAGDTFAYGAYDRQEKEERERESAERVFGALPDDQAGALKALWEEFEHGDTKEARLVRALDRLQPLLLHRLTFGKAWKEHAVKKSQVLERVQDIARDAPALWPFVERLLDEATRAGQLEDA
jgi:putative hydrolase of HD superfamily